MPVGEPVAEPEPVVEETEETEECQDVKIVAATWGVEDVTPIVSKLYADGKRSIGAESEVLGKKKLKQQTLTIVYDECGSVQVKAVTSGDYIKLP